MFYKIARLEGNNHVIRTPWPLCGLLTVLMMAPSVSAIDQPIIVGDHLVFPEGAQIPAGLTPTERLWLLQHPLRTPDDAGPIPTGPVHCVAEYEATQGIWFAWEQFSDISAQLITLVTTTGNADAYVMCDTAAEITTATNFITPYGANMSRVKFFVAPTDTVWIRDYGPRYIYEGNCRAIIDHTYNRPRPQDDAQPAFVANTWKQARYAIPLTHGGGNYHLDALGRSYCTRLVNNENPSLTETQIHDLWQTYQNVDTHFFDPFPTSVDSTQHLDMWMQVAGDNTVVISNWPNNVGSTQALICDNAAVYMAGQGYTVYRTPARFVSGVHYTFTNVLMCNNLIVVPTYTNTSLTSNNTQAWEAWKLAAPTKTVVQVNAQAMISSAGAFHCIVMHVPVHKGGLNPTAYLKNLRGGETLNHGNTVQINWISDDDKFAVQSVDLLLSTDGGVTWPTTIASGIAPSGQFVWTVPDVATTHARVRVVVHDNESLTGSDESAADITIVGTPPACPGDLDGNHAVDLADLSIALANYGMSPATPEQGDLDGNGVVDLSDISILISVYGGVCP